MTFLTFLLTEIWVQQIQIPLGSTSGVGKFSDGNTVSGKVDSTFGDSVSNA